MSTSEEVFIVDDDPLLRRTLARLVTSAGHEVRTFGSAGELLESWDGVHPRCLILDLRLPDLDGMELYSRLRTTGSVPPVIFITGFGDIPTSVQAMKSGALDFILKPFVNDALLGAIESALEEETRSRASRDRLQSLAQRYATLTTREREVMALVVAGRMNKQVARDLRISEKTVKVHRGRVMAKMEARRVAQLVQLAIRLDLAIQAEPGVPQPETRVPAAPTLPRPWSRPDPVPNTAVGR